MGSYVGYAARVSLFKKVLVANRGEIAVRLVRALKDLGIASVAAYSDADRGSLAVRLADEAANVGPSPSSESYLRIDRVIDAAKLHGAQAIHPGYGFLSENADFAEACASAGIVFIGPPAEAIQRLGSKTAARQLAIAAGAPVVPGTERALSSWEEARSAANALGYPILLKASAGGGGKGMRRVDGESQLQAALRDAASEAGRAFGNSEVYVEKLVEEPRHIEIQILGDQHGNLIHLGERECSIQRRHQKVIEECPSPLMASHPDLREKMGQAALKVAHAAGYTNAGTVEFLVDRDANFYFLEVNTRLQVEHPVTELVTGLDLVEWQLKIAAGERLTLRQENVTWHGSAIECRIYAEDPDRDFLPAPGRILHLSEPSGPGIRLDSGIFEGWNVPLEYDPLLAKLAAWGPTRDTAIRRLDRALAEYVLTGVGNNIAFFREVLADTEFREGRLSTSFLDGFFKRRKKSEVDPEAEAAAALAVALSATSSITPPRETSKWLDSGCEDRLR
jgi:acetyl-CoA carboxylase biotin carboxylase subunit